MSIVLPRKNGDFLAPSKALEDARKKLGTIYFDAKLLECPQNAVELARLSKKLDDIDRKKFKTIEDTNRSQRILLHTLTSRYRFAKSNTSLQAIPDFEDIKLPPPGFRYHSNGEPKLSLIVADQKPHVDELRKFRVSSKSVDELKIAKSYSSPKSFDRTYVTSPENHFQSEAKNQSEHDRLRPEQKHLRSEARHGDLKVDEKELDPAGIPPKLSTDNFVSGESEITLVRTSTPENQLAINYDTEIPIPQHLEKTIRAINEDLEKNQMDLYGNAGSAKGKVYAFLRAHPNGDKLSFKKLVDPKETTRPNDRFAFQPGASTFPKSEVDLHKLRFKTPRHSSCIACQVNLKHDKENFRQMKKDLARTVFKRWNYVPQGKVADAPLHSVQSKNSTNKVQSKKSGHSSQSSSNSKRNEKSMTSIKNISKSLANFKGEGISSSDRSLKKRTVSTYSIKVQHSRNVVVNSITNNHRREHSAKSVMHVSSGTQTGQSTIDFLKIIAVKEGEECQRKVQDFLQRLDQFNEKPKIKVAFV